MSEDIHKWSDGRYVLMFDEHTFFVFDKEKEERMTALETTKMLNEQQATINRLQRKCFELEKDYLIETSDISDKIYLEDEIKELKEKYGVIDDE